MCGRYCLFPDENEEIRRILEEIDAQYGPEAVKTGEIFPTNPAPVLLPQGDGLQPCPMVWGFPKFGGKGVIINSRGETAAEKRMFRSSLLQRRCAIPTTGFYEWDQEKKMCIRDRSHGTPPHAGSRLPSGPQGRTPRWPPVFRFPFPALSCSCLLYTSPYFLIIFNH